MDLLPDTGDTGDAGPDSDLPDSSPDTLVDSAIPDASIDTSAADTYSDTFEVMPDTGVETPDAGEDIGFSDAGPVYPAPSVTSITPDKGDYGSSVKITSLSGIKFRSGATVKLSKEGQPDIPATLVNVVSTKKIECKFDLAGAVSGAWDVTVTNSDTISGTGKGLFFIKYPTPPNVNTIAPDRGASGELLTGVVITGNGFRPGANVKLSKEGSTDIKAGSTTVDGPTSIYFQIDLSGASEGRWDVAVENIDGQNAVLLSAFEVFYRPPMLSSITPSSAMNYSIV
ncbi:MAG: hypothetical protein WC889_15660, partial [Myxococcota bacterium]